MLTPHAANQLRLQLVAIPGLCDQAHEDLEPSGAAGSGMPSGTRTPPIPARLDILSLLGPASTAEHIPDPHHDQIGDRPAAAILSSWCELIWGYPCTNVRTACRLLLGHDAHATAITAGYAEDYAHEIGQLYTRLTRLARTYTPPVALRCPKCRQRALAVDPGHGYLCTEPTCNITLPPDLYDHLAEQERIAQLERNDRARERRQRQAAAAAAAAAAELTAAQPTAIDHAS